MNKVIIFLNPHCNHGKSFAMWQDIKEEVGRRLNCIVTEIISPSALVKEIRMDTGCSDRIFIAAGGDGTVNLLVNEVIKNGTADSVIIGAIGLGSSNDFHKPYVKQNFIAGIPVRINTHDVKFQDSIKVRFLSNQATWITHYSAINCSIGITAYGNYLFNSKGTIMKLAHRISTGLAITLAALQSIFHYKNFPCAITVNGADKGSFLLSNAGIIKNQHFTGSLAYDTEIAPDDGEIGINLCFGMSFFEKLKMLHSLSRQKFNGLKKTLAWKASEASASSNDCFALEIDGEVFETRHAVFKVLPKAVRCCA